MEFSSNTISLVSHKLRASNHHRKMSGSEVARIAKPQMRGLLESAIKKNLIVATVLSITSGIAYKFLVCDAQKQRYADFYKNYDAEKECKRMQALGLFQSG